MSEYILACSVLAVLFLRFTFYPPELAEALIYICFIVCTTAMLIYDKILEAKPLERLHDDELKKEVEKLRSEVNALKLKDGFGIK